VEQKVGTVTTTSRPVSAPVDPDHREILEGLRGFVDHEVAPLEEAHREVLEDPRRTYDTSGAYAPEVRELLRAVRTAAAAAGFYTMFAPEDVGGAGLGATPFFLAWEFLHRYCGPGRILPMQAIAHWAAGPGPVLRGFGPSLRPVHEAINDGRELMCFALSEPDAGSDVWNMSTSAVADGEDWLITGTKQWITNSPIADHALVFAVTDPELKRARRGGITAFLVPTSSPGFRVDSVIKLFGSVGSNEAIISFDAVRVPSTSVVGELHQGFGVAVDGVSLGRLFNAARSVGLAAWALDAAASYAASRSTFGHVIADYQGVSFPLADSAMELYAARSMGLDAAGRIEAGLKATLQVDMAKGYAVEMCHRVYDRAMQVHGGMGFTSELRLYEGWHHSRILRVADGSAEILRRNIARRIVRGDGFI
jgi:acyl-CoA dehydrogenase